MGSNEWVYNQYKHCIRVRIVCGEKVDMYSSGQLIVNPQHYIEPDLSAAGNDTEVNIERRSGNLIKRTCFVNLNAQGKNRFLTFSGMNRFSGRRVLRISWSNNEIMKS